jgi:hypothetical protein
MKLAKASRCEACLWGHEQRATRVVTTLTKILKRKVKWKLCDVCYADVAANTQIVDERKLR